MLAFESGAVINQRLGKLWLGDQAEGWQWSRRTAVFEAATLMARGRTFDNLVERYRKAVAANALRLR